MSKRKAIPTRVWVFVAIRQARESAQAGCEYFACGICRKELHESEPRILEHTPPRATLIANGCTNPDDPKYLSLVHESCARVKTNGTKATSAGSDKHMIAKGHRLAVARLAKSEVEKKLTKERWRLKKKVSGEVVKVRTR